MDIGDIGSNSAKTATKIGSFAYGMKYIFRQMKQNRALNEIFLLQHLGYGWLQSSNPRACNTCHLPLHDFSLSNQTRILEHTFFNPCLPSPICLPTYLSGFLTAEAQLECGNNHNLDSRLRINIYLQLLFWPWVKVPSPV